MREHIGAVAGRLIEKTSRPQPQRQPSFDFWQDLNEELRAAWTKEEQDAVWERYKAAKAQSKPSQRQRRGSTLNPVHFRPLDRNQRVRIVCCAECLDAKTREPGKHGGCLKRTGLHLLRILLF